MKKVLSTVVAFGLVAGMATGAAALELKVKGDYTVDGFYIDSGNGAASENELNGKGVRLATNFTNPLTPDMDVNADAWLQHMFNMEAELVVNDKISMMSRIRLVDWGSVWGVQDDNSLGSGANDGGNMSVDRLWMVYKSPIGIWEIGRRPAGAWGLSFVDNGYGGDRIFWKSGKLFGEEFSAYAFFEKTVEGEAYFGDTDDMDGDYYEVAGSLKGGWGSATLAYGLSLNNTQDHNSMYHVHEYDFVGNNNDPVTGKFVASNDVTAHRFKGVGQFKFGGNMGFDTEFDYKWGEKDFNSNLLADQDISQLAFIADFNAKFDALTGHAIYFYTSGDDNAKDTDLESYGGPGADFEPLYVLTGVFGNILNNDQGTNNLWGAAAKTAGTNAFILSADFAVNQDLTLHGAIGYAMAANELAGWDDSYGFEYNAGAAYKLVDNLVYAVHLGYLDTDDFFKLGTMFKDTESIFLASHHLTMSF